MLCVETIGKIRRRRLVKQDSISGIARDLGLSRNTVKKALRSGVEPFEYRREHQPRPQLGPYLGMLDEWLAADAKLQLRERRTRAIEAFRFHDLRHTWASWHVMSGTSLQELMELGGWKSYEMMLRYAHLASEHLSAAAQWIERVWGVVDSDSTISLHQTA